MPLLYKLLMTTNIPVAREGEGYRTLDLWVRDLEVQVGTTGEICLVAPLGNVTAKGSLPVPPGVRLICDEELRGEQDVRRLVEEADVVQIQGGVPHREAARYYRFAGAARTLGRGLVLSISSNRAKATLLNARPGAWLRRLKAAWRARGIRKTQEELASMADGVIVVGHGLLELVEHRNPNVHVGIASWISEADLINPSDYERKVADARARRPRLCVATRLERMKGVHLAIEALRLLRNQLGDQTPTLTIFGVGPDRPALGELVERLGLADLVDFAGTFAYPRPFFDQIRQHDLMLLTNLSDEQPRLIFDAIAQGLIPVCPDSAPYRELGLADRFLFESNNVGSLAARIAQLLNQDATWADFLPLRDLAAHHTIERMHRDRALWISQTLAEKRAATVNSADGR